MLRAVFGITGWSGIDARCSTTTRASGLAPSSGVSNSRTMATNSSDNVLAMSRARTGDWSRTATSIRTVSGFALALTFSRSAFCAHIEAEFVDSALSQGLAHK